MPRYVVRKLFTPITILLQELVVNAGM
eukprot:COSAG01_NODE_34122_length_552_cov_189.066225_1_plen_26_part_01